jgi:hypothetical protein
MERDFSAQSHPAPGDSVPHFLCNTSEAHRASLVVAIPTSGQHHRMRIRRLEVGLMYIGGGVILVILIIVLLIILL